jgi:serine/threonine-protein kinase
MDDTTRTASSLRPGTPSNLTRWNGFDLVECVGQGGFGEVFRAYDPVLRREIAVKLLLKRENEGRQDQESSLLREARAMARVVHPNLVAIYGVGTHEGRAGFWSAFVRGKTLSTLLSANGPFGPQETMLIGIDVCRAVGAVHAAGMVHGDIKPGNVMREEGGRILLMDFGLTESQASQTTRGGTLKYMAPEILHGGHGTVRTDIYAIGVLLYHILTAGFPQGENWSLLEKRPDLAPALVSVIHRAIDPDPEKRFATAAEMTAALADVGGISVPLAPVTPAPNRTKRWIAPAAMLVVALGAGAYAWRTTHATSAPAASQKRYDKAHDLVEHYYRPKALDTAIPELEAITREAPEFAAGFADLGFANFLQFWQLRDPKYVEPARTASLKAISLDSNLASPHVTLGMLYTQTSQNDLATQEIDQALRLDRLNAAAWAARAELYMRQGRIEDVEPTLRKAIDLAPGDWRWEKQLSDFYSRTGKLDKAIEASQETVRLSPDNARAYNNLGEYLSIVRRLPEAETALRKAIALEPGYHRYKNLGEVERDLGRNSEAEKMFQQAIALNPSDYAAWDDFADLYRREQPRSPRVLETYRKAIGLAEDLRRTKPAEPFLLADLGEMYSDTGDSERAVPLLRQAMTLAPDDSDILFECGAAFETLHMRSDAIDAIVTALRKGYARAAVESSPELVNLRNDPKYLAMPKAVK